MKKGRVAAAVLLLLLLLGGGAAAGIFLLGRFQINIKQDVPQEAESSSPFEDQMVVVLDRKPPVITLINDPEAYTLPGHTYEEEGFAAYDETDGDLTSQVTSTVRDGKVYYEVADRAGNKAYAERDIVYGDYDPPVLTLEEADVVIELGNDYEEPGFSAEDNADGDLTDKVEVSGDIDIYLEGSYVLTYTVSDNYGNQATAQRTVTVKKVRREEEGEKLIYLTFDDGPGPYTERLLGILDKYHVKATFFVTNQFPGYQYLIGEEAAAGHAVGVHTYTHEFSEVYASTKAFWADFEKMQDIIEQQTGSRTVLMRFPGGSSNLISANYKQGIMTKLVRQATNKGYTYFDWNVLSGDAGDTTSSKQIVKNIMAGIAEHNTSVVLCHDIHEYTVDAMESFIKKALKQGYTFEVLEADSFPAHHQVNN